MMADKPIIFSGPMIRALIDGRKTQTRLVLETQPESPRVAGAALMGDQWVWRDGFDGSPIGPIYIPYAHGDCLWVREQHYLTDDGEAECVIYTADDDAVAQHHSDIARLQAQHGFSDEWAKPHLRIRPSIHMPRWASRLTMTVTDVRVQRLQDISEADAIAEGIKPHGHAFTGYGKQADVWMAPYDSFASLWNSLHGPGAWGANPWVVALTFSVEKRNIDDGGA